MKKDRTDGRGIVSCQASSDDIVCESGIRPLFFKDYIGQDRAKENLKIFIDAALKRGEPLDHVLLSGSAGLGKTTLAGIIAGETGRDIRTTSGPAIERPIDLVIILKGLHEGDVLFIDEIHRLRRPIEEILYSAMEDFMLDRVINKGVGARPVRIRLPKFTLVGATTRIGSLSSPLRARFGIILPLSFYDDDQLKDIILRAAGILQVRITEDAALEIASRSRGTPRIANRMLRRVRDFADVKNGGVIDSETARDALKSLAVDRNGLDLVDRAILESMAFRFKGRPAGLDSIAAAVSEEPENIEEVYEPYLLKIGFIEKTSRGRQLLPAAYDYLGIDCSSL